MAPTADSARKNFQMKILFHIFIFAAGVGAGIWWSVSHPDAAASIADREQQEAVHLQAAVAQAKIELLEKFLASSSDPAAKSDATNNNSNEAGYQRMLDDEKKKLDAAKQQMN
jgi:hypothetical protein